MTLPLKTGLRVSELAAIRKEHIDFKRHLIKVVRLKRKRQEKESQAHYIKRNTESIASHLLKKEADRINAKLQRDFENDVAKADKAYQEVKRAGSDIVKPKLPNTFKYIQNSAECKENPAPC